MAKVWRLTLNHKGGTKFYQITVIETDEGKGLLIRRWGKMSSFGELKIERYPNINAAENAAQKLNNSKQNGGYIPESPSMTKGDQEEIKKFLGRAMWAKLPADAIQYCWPDADVSGRRELDPPRFDENGNFLGNPPPRTIEITQEMKDQARLELIERERERNPLFGRF